MSDRWSSNPRQDFIESVACVMGYSCERLPPPRGRAGRAEQEPPPCSTAGAPDALHPENTRVRRSRAKVEHPGVSSGLSLCDLGPRGETRTERGQFLSFSSVCVFVCVTARSHRLLPLFVCVRPGAVTHFTASSLIQTLPVPSSLDTYINI